MLLNECPYCRQYFSAKGMEHHIRFRHFDEWLRSQPKKPSLSTKRVRQLPPGGSIDPQPSLKTDQSRLTNSGAKPERVILHPISYVPPLSPKPYLAAASTVQAVAQKTGSANVKRDVNKSGPPSPPKSKKSKKTKAARQGSKVRTVSAYALTKWHMQLPRARVSAQVSTRTPPQVDVQCSCGGENSRCFRCDGRGYYEVPAMQEGAQAPTTLVRAVTSPGVITNFAADGRGGERTVRENGKFLSNAVHDDYGDESSG
jgi:hypothetical protein